jgi:hypothetical protein
MNIAEVVTTYKRLKPNGHFFDRDTLSYFGQKLEDFKVIETEDPSIIRLEHRTWFNEHPFDHVTLFNIMTGEMNTESAMVAA